MTEDYMRESGQVVPKKPISHLLLKELVRIEDQRRQVIGLPRVSELKPKDAGKVKKRLARSTAVYVDDDEEEVGEDIQETVEDMNEDEDLDGFVVPDPEFDEAASELEEQALRAEMEEEARVEAAARRKFEQQAKLRAIQLQKAKGKQASRQASRAPSRRASRAPSEQL
jgi:hypothetical protein